MTAPAPEEIAVGGDGTEEEAPAVRAPSRRERGDQPEVDVLRKMDMADLEQMRLNELRELARDYRVTGYSGLKKDNLILLLLRAKAEREGFSFGGGILEITDEGIGFLRSTGYAPGSDDVYVSQSQIRALPATGDMVVGRSVRQRHGEIRACCVSKLKRDGPDRPSTAPGLSA